MKKAFLLLAWLMISGCHHSKKIQVPHSGNPDCVREMIKRFSAEEVTNPKRSIYSYSFQGRTVYYVPAPCCDFFSDLYDGHCNLLGHPDGGITGKGDGKLVDFPAQRTDEKLIWKDPRNEQK